MKAQTRGANVRLVIDETAPLSVREVGMLQRRAEGWTYERIGAAYGVTKSRVGQVLAEAQRLLGVGAIDEAVAEAKRRGLIE